MQALTALSNELVSIGAEAYISNVRNQRKSTVHLQCMMYSCNSMHFIMTDT